MRNKSVSAIIIVTDPENAGLYNLPILGRKCIEWVVSSLGDISHTVVDRYSETDLFGSIRPYLTDSDYTVILHSDTPLLTKSTLLSAIEYCIREDYNVLKLKRGFVVNTQYIKRNEVIGTKIFESSDEDFATVGSSIENAYIISVLKNRILNYHLQQGVNILDPATINIDSHVTIAGGVTIYPNNVLRGKTQVCEGAVLDIGNIIEDTFIGKNCYVLSSRLQGSVLGANVNIGPNANLRTGSVIGNSCKIGNFVEIKNSTIGDNTKISHLTYVGDADIGKNVNIGAGVVFANYDGKNKHKTFVQHGAFIGSNSTLIAPVTIGANALIAGGSTITEDVPPSELAIGRARQVNKERKQT